MSLFQNGCVLARLKGIKPLTLALLLPAAVASRGHAQSIYAAPYAFANFAGDPGVPGYANAAGASAEFNAPDGVTVDAGGNVYVADQDNHVIRRIDPLGNVTLLAGSPGTHGSADGNGSAALFYLPAGVAVDSSGNVYVADELNMTIRKIDTAANVTTLAGSPGASGTADGNGSAANFAYPTGVAVDTAGNVYVADYINSTIRKIDTSANVTTLAGSAGMTGSADGNGASARFYYPYDLAVDSAGNIYVADQFNNTIRKIDTSANVTTLAGNPASAGSADGNGSGALFNSPTGITVDAAGYVYVTDQNNFTIRRLDASGNVTTLAGTVGVHGTQPGSGPTALFYFPTGIAADGSGNLYIGDTSNHRINKGSVAPAASLSLSFIRSPQAAFTNWVGFPGAGGYANGQGTAARFDYPDGVAADSSGNIYVADQDNNVIRKVDSFANVTTLAGNPTHGSADGNGTAAHFYLPAGLAVDTAGNVYVADELNMTIRKIDTSANVTTLAGSPGASGTADGNGSAANFAYPTGVAVDTAGNVYVADYINSTIRKIDPSANVTTLAGSAGVTGSADGNGASARFYYPYDLALDGAGNIYVADQFNNTIRKIDTSANVTTLAGNPAMAGSVDGRGGAAQFNSPTCLTADSAGDIYVTDQNNDTIRKIDTSANVTTLAGAVGISGSADGIGSVARFNEPTGMAMDSSGNLYVTDANHRVTKGLIVPSVAILSWTGGGTLQSAVNVSGPYIDMPGQTSPFSFVPDGPQNFYRVR